MVRAAAGRHTAPAPGARRTPSLPSPTTGYDEAHLQEVEFRDEVHEVPKVAPPPLDAPPRSKWQKKRQDVGWKMNAAKPSAYSAGLPQGPELHAVAILLQDRRWAGEASERIDPSLFEDDRLRAIFEVLISLGSDEPLDTVELSLGTDAPAALEAFHEIVERQEALVPAGGTEGVQGVVRQFAVRRLDRDIEELERRVNQTVGDDGRALFVELVGLKKARRILLASGIRT
ncbi:MAG: hypothetical protein U5K74_01800 [Gemmatimonadaceae bacterium]|nr:hypothetical protein [Gemmatimonadaceae bacterium]